MKLQLHWQIIICMLLGTITGVYFNSIDYTTNNLYALIILLGDIFIRLLKMIKALAESYQNDEQELMLSEEQYRKIDKRREAHLKGESKSFTWEQVKQNARNAG